MKKIVAMLLAVLLLALPLASLADVAKDETVYALLGTDGAAKKVLVVSHLDTPEAGDYVDYGAYTEITAMLSDIQPEVDGDTITWTLPADPEGFYAVGTLEAEAVQLPFGVSIGYTLDGTETDAASLGGQSGHVQLTLTITPNAQVDAHFAGQYAAQVQLPLSLAAASNVQAPGATTALIGQTLTLTYIALPGQEAVYTVDFDAVDFAMDAITIAGTQMDIEGMLGFDLGELQEQIEPLREGARQLADGGSQLSEGMTALADGVATLAAGAAALPSGIRQLGDGMNTLTAALGALPEQVKPLDDAAQTLATGTNEYINGAQAALSATGDLSAALGDLAAMGPQLTEGFDAVSQALAPLLAQLPQEQQAVVSAQLGQLTEGLAQYTQGVTEIAGQTQTLTQSIAPLTENGPALAAGSTQLAAGIAQLAQGLSGLDTQLSPLTQGIAALQTGADQLVSGIDTLNEQVAALPEQVQVLADGQTEFADGIDEAIGQLADALPAFTTQEDAQVSFVSPEHPARSVQFVYMTEAIARPQAEQAEAPEEAAQSFWDRLKALF